MKPRKTPALRAALALLATVAAIETAHAGWTEPKPFSAWKVPGEIKVPTGPWLEPGDIQIPKGIAAVKTIDDSTCIRHVTIVADALFDFDKAELRGDAEETLVAAAPEIAKAGTGKLTVVGHTDAVGSDTYNDQLSEARAETVRDWLGSKGFIPADTAIEGRGEKQPIAPNSNADGSDNPEGRQLNRRVEIEINACG